MSGALVLKVNLLSLGLGKETPSPVQGSTTVSVRIIDIAVGKRFAPPFGLAVGATVGEFFQTPSNSGRDFPFNGPTLDLYAFGGPPAASWGSRGIVFAHVAVNPVLCVRAAVGANWTLWALNPEVEVGYRYVRDRYQTGYPPIWYEERFLQFSAFLRVGLGGWYEF